MASLCLIHFYPHFVDAQARFWRFRRGKTELLTVTFLFTTEFVYYHEPLFLLTIISTVGLQLYSLYLREMISLVIWRVWWRGIGHTSLSCAGNGLTRERQYCRPRQKGNLVNASVKQCMNRISVPTTWSLLVVGVKCAPAINIHFRPTLNTSTFTVFEYVSMGKPLDHQY